MRTLLGGVLLALVLLPKWRKIEWKKNWPIYIISALFNIIIFNGVQTLGLQYLPSGLFSVIVYLQPVLVVLLAWMWLKESLSFLKIVGMPFHRAYNTIVLTKISAIRLGENPSGRYPHHLILRYNPSVQIDY